MSTNKVLARWLAVGVAIGAVVGSVGSAAAQPGGLTATVARVQERVSATRSTPSAHETQASLVADIASRVGLRAYVRSRDTSPNPGLTPIQIPKPVGVPQEPVKFVGGKFELPDPSASPVAADSPGELFTAPVGTAKRFEEPTTNRSNV